MAIYNPKTDLVFKKLFGSEENKDLLQSLINSILPAHQQIVKLTLKNPYNVSDYVEGKLSILDIKAEDEKGIRYDIEMQIRGDAFYGRRVLYYWAKMFGTQLDYVDPNEENPIDENGTTFEYSELKKCIVISFMDFNFFKDERYQRFFMLKDAQTNETTQYLDYLDLYFIEMKKFKGDLKVIQTTLERWITFLNKANYYREENLPEELAKINEIKKASTKLTTMYFTEKEKAMYDGQQKWYMDNQSILTSEKEKARKLGEKEGLKLGKKEGKEIGKKEGKEIGLKEGKEIGLKEGKKEGKEIGLKEGKKEGKEIGLKEGQEIGLKEGKERGLKQGKEQGLKEAKIEVAKNLKNLNLPIQSIIEATGLTQEEIEKL